MGRFAYYARSLMKLASGFRAPWTVAGLLVAPPPHGATRTVQLRNGLRFVVRGFMDVWILKETFLDEFYLRYGWKPQPGWTVVDVGAGIGDYCIQVASLEPAARVIACEPYPPSFELLKRNLTLNAIQTVTPVPWAMASQDGVARLDLHVDEPLQMCLAPDGKLEVEAVSLASLLERLKLGRCDVLKLDCEGAEHAILRQASPETLKRVARVVLEVHDGPQGTREELVHFLKWRGYTVEVWPNPVHRHLAFMRAWR